MSLQQFDHAWRSASIRLLLHTAAIALAVAATSACLSPGGVSLKLTRGIELNPKVRTDREALNASQQIQPEYSGAYRDGKVLDANGMSEQGLEGSEVVAPLTPTGISPLVLEKLMQSNCLWQGDSQSGPVSDVAPVSATWEFIAEVLREPMHLDCMSPVRFGLCRLREPLTANPIVFQPLSDSYVACGGSEPPPVETIDVDFGGIDLRTLALRNADSGPVQIDDDLDLAVLPLVAEYVVRTPASDPRRSCPGTVGAAQQITGATTVPASLEGDVGCTAGSSPAGGGASLAGCGKDCRTRAPAGDSALVLRDTSRGGVRWLRPNLMVIDRTGSLTRPMVANGSVREWQVGVSPNSDKWHENFTPDLVVTSVRVFVPGPDPASSSDDRTPNLAVFQDPNVPTFNQPALIINGRYRESNGGEKVFRTVCRGAPSGNGYEFPFEASGMPPVDCAGDQVTSVQASLTPAYVTNHLNVSSAGVPFNVPLSWSVQLVAGSTERLEIEFRLRATGGRSSRGLLATPAGTQFGGVVVGDHAQGWIEYSNVGDLPLTVVSATLGGSNPTDFGFRLVAAHTPLPLPLSVKTTPGKRVIRLIETGSVVVSDRAAAVTVGPEHIRIVRPDRDAQVLNVYGNQLRYDGDLAFPVDNVVRPVPYQFPPGTVPLDVLDVYTEARLPLVLAPGRSLRVAVKAQPRSVDLRRAQLTLEADVYTAPIQRLRATAALEVYGHQGPMPDLLPAQRNWGTTTRTGATQMVLLVNNGDRDLVRGRISTAANRGFTVERGNAPTQVLPPGTSEAYAVRYTPICPAAFGSNATDTLLVETNVGTQRVNLWAAYPDCR